MSRSDLITSLVSASALGDSNLIKRTVEAIVADEHAKNHHLLAEKLWEVFETSRKRANNKAASVRPVSSTQAQLTATKSTVSRGAVPSAPEEILELLHEVWPERGLADMFLEDSVLLNCQELIEEQLRADLLRNSAIEPRNRIVIAGPPGNGKTSLAHAIAFETGLPLYVLKYESIIGSFLGETSNRLRRIFEFVRTRPCVVFFDEFDALGKERGDAHETGEIKRVVSSLLLQIDALPTYNIIIAATNHSELIDKAAWRRFQLRLELVAPSDGQIRQLLLIFEQSIDARIMKAFPQLARSLAGLSYSDIEQFLLDIKRRWILRKNSESLISIVQTRLNLLNARLGTREKIKKDETSSAPSITESDSVPKGKGQFEIF